MGFRTLPAVKLLLPEDERVIVNVSFARQSVPFALGLTDRAVYVPVIDRWSLRQPWRMLRVPLEQVQNVSVRRTRPSIIWAVASLMIVLGAITTGLMVLPLLNGLKGKVSIWPLIVVIAGAVLPFTARGRRTLHIEFASDKPYEWKPPFYAADMTKDHIAYLLEQVVKGFRSLRVYVHEE